MIFAESFVEGGGGRYRAEVAGRDRQASPTFSPFLSCRDSEATEHNPEDPRLPPIPNIPPITR
ncbi:MAG TPA: hypothetical protein DCP63_09880 [Bacteroidetes bacterium]|nr:hypothetical protein [Bacteroidota bacterium]